MCNPKVFYEMPVVKNSLKIINSLKNHLVSYLHNNKLFLVKKL